MSALARKFSPVQQAYSAAILIQFFKRADLDQVSSIQALVASTHSLEHLDDTGFFTP
jgi:hypothetical protein